jgi:hypothetical protein
MENKKAIAKRVILGESGSVSLTKLGGWLVSAAGFILSQGLVGSTGTAHTVCTAILAIGGALGVAGVRDAIKK